MNSPLRSIVIVGLVSLGIVLNVLRRGHNGLRATLRRPVGDVAREATGILTRISAGEALVYGSIGLIGLRDRVSMFLRYSGHRRRASVAT